MMGRIVLSANFVTLAGMILTAASALGVAIIAQGRSGSRDRDAIKDAVEAGFRATKVRSDKAVMAAQAAHDEIRTTNGHTAGELIEQTAADLASHITADLEAIAELQAGQKALATLLEDHISWAMARSDEVQSLHDAQAKPT